MTGLFSHGAVPMDRVSEDKYIDLVIPRGSKELVRSIKAVAGDVGMEKPGKNPGKTPGYKQTYKQTYKPGRCFESYIFFLDSFVENPLWKLLPPCGQDASRIPVLGHADGICAVYVGASKRVGRGRVSRSTRS